MKPAHMQDVSRLPTKCNIADLTAQDTGIGGFILTFTCTPNFRVTVFSMSLVFTLKAYSDVLFIKHVLAARRCVSCKWMLWVLREMESHFCLKATASVYAAF